MKTSSFLKAAAITASLVASGLFSAGSATAQTTPSWINNSPLIHSYVHGGLVNNNQANNAVGATGVLRGQLSWQTPADLDIRLLLPDGVGPYVGSNFESFLLKNPLFTDTPDRHVWAGQKTVDFSNGQAKAALDVDVRDGVANGPNGQRIENIYLSGNIPTGTYQFAVENYDNSHYHRNNPDAPATQFNLAVTLKGAGYIIPSDNMPFEVATGYAYGATGALKEHAAVSPIYEVNYFNPGLDTLHAPGIDLFKRFNSNFLPAAYLTALSVPGINPARAPSFIDELRPQKTHLDSTENLANMGRNRLEADFQKLLASGDKNATMAYRLRNGDIINAGKGDFLKAFLAIDASNAKKREADAFLAGLPEQTLREFQDIQKQHGVLNNIRELRSGDRIAVLPSQVTNAITQNQGEWHKNDAQIAHQIFNDMVAGRTTTNAAKLFTNKQAIAYDGTPMDVAYVRNSHGDVLAMSRQMIAEQASNAEYTKYLNALRAAEQRRLEAERQKANQYAGLVCTNAAANASVACDAPGAVFMSPSLPVAQPLKEYKVTMPVYTTKWGIFGREPVLVSETVYTVYSKDEFLSLNAEAGRRYRETADAWTGIVNRGETTYEVMGYMPIVGEAQGAYECASGTNASGDSLQGISRASSCVGAIPALGKAKKGMDVATDVTQNLIEREARDLAEGQVQKSAAQLGQEGEKAVRAVYNIGEKPSSPILMNGRGRIPDGLSGEVVSEVKNVKKLSFTKQLRDYSDFAQQTGRRFDLYTRPSTEPSGPLQDAIDSGIINRINIPE
ncbi:putative toxin [Hydrogenophaga sp.]|uniref:putative toxin n=1 Tax=Hydrogenophaga sp. TaxID=1904254 RepID=UPI0035B0EC08